MGAQEHPKGKGKPDVLHISHLPVGRVELDIKNKINFLIIY